MKRILFLIKNGIGFGHMQRTLLVAEEIQRLEPKIDIIFITQANSLSLLENSSFRVINFPFLHRLPNDQSEHACQILLNKIVSGLKAALMVEDTYPDSWYLSVPAVQNIPKILLMRRITPLAFNDFRCRGYFSLYDRIIMVQDEREFLSENHVRESELLVQLTNRFQFVNPIFRLPTNSQLECVKAKYRDGDNPLIVVNAGAGGAHLNDSYCQQLFSSMSKVALRFQKAEIPACFIFVMGPYYKGPKPEAYSNTIIVDFEPNLSALLSMANVAVIKPGFNCTYEALSGSAHIILIPGISYLEDQYRWVKYLKSTYGVSIGRYDDVEFLYNEIITLLQQSTLNRTSKRQNPIIPGQLEAARIIIQETNRFEYFDTDRKELLVVPIFLLIGRIPHSFSKSAKELFRKVIPEIALTTEDRTSQGDVFSLDFLLERHPADDRNERLNITILQANKTMDLTIEMLMKHNVGVVLYTDKTSFGTNAKKWCRHYLNRFSGILQVELYHFLITSQWKRQLLYRISKLISLRNPVTIYLDLSKLETWEEIEIFAENMGEWLVQKKFPLLSIKEMICEQTQIRLMPPYDLADELEIENLK